MTWDPTIFRHQPQLRKQLFRWSPSFCKLLTIGVRVASPAWTAPARARSARPPPPAAPRADNADSDLRNSAMDINAHSLRALDWAVVCEHLSACAATLAGARAAATLELLDNTDAVVELYATVQEVITLSEEALSPPRGRLGHRPAGHGGRALCQPPARRAPRTGPRHCRAGSPGPLDPEPPHPLPWPRPPGGSAGARRRPGPLDGRRL